MNPRSGSRRGIGSTRLGESRDIFAVVRGDGTARSDSATLAGGVEGCLKMVAADIVEVHVDAVGGDSTELLRIRSIAIVEGGVEPQIPDQRLAPSRHSPHSR